MLNNNPKFRGIAEIVLDIGSVADGGFDKKSVPGSEDDRLRCAGVDGAEVPVMGTFARSKLPSGLIFGLVNL